MNEGSRFFDPVKGLYGDFSWVVRIPGRNNREIIPYCKRRLHQKKEFLISGRCQETD